MSFGQNEWMDDGALEQQFPIIFFHHLQQGGHSQGIFSKITGEWNEGSKGFKESQ